MAEAAAVDLLHAQSPRSPAVAPTGWEHTGHTGLVPCSWALQRAPHQLAP